MNDPVTAPTQIVTPNGQSMPVYNAGLATGVPVAPSSTNTPATTGLTDTFNPATYTPVETPDQVAVDNANAARVTASSLSTNPNQDDMTNATGQFQAEIDADNATYAQQEAQAAQVGLQNLGSNTAIESRRGLLGSDFGTAQTMGVQANTQNTENDITTKHNSDLATVYQNINRAANANAAARVKAIQGGADANLTYLQNKQANATTAVTNAVTSYFAAGNDGSKLSTDDIDKWATALGTDPATVLNAVATAKQANDAQALKTQTDNANLAKTIADTAHIGVPASADEYTYAKTQGYTGTFEQYQNDQDARKIAIAQASRAPKEAPALTQSEEVQQPVTRLQNIITHSSTLKDGTPILFPKGYMTYTAWKAFISQAPSEGLTRTQFIQNFGYLLENNGKSIDSQYGLTPAEQKLALGTLPTN
jgi:Skp family chaperone for outer membrane proteins